MINSGQIPKFTELNELAADTNGGRILFATDDWFAAAECMISATEPIFIPEKYTEYGKWMDGWETRRKRIPGHDWCIIKLGAACKVKGLVVDTAFFTGNYAPRISLQGVKLSTESDCLIPKRQENRMGTACGDEELKQISKLHSETWSELLPMTTLNPGYEETRKHYFEIENCPCVTHLRLNMYPDGGIARLRVYGEVKRSIKEIKEDSIIDLISLENGGTCVAYSNAHFGHPRNLIKPGFGVNMGDGWETSRRLDRPPILKTDSDGILQVNGNEWAIFKLGFTGIVEQIIVDTRHFKGNFPDSIKIEGCLLKDGDLLNIAKWEPLLSNRKLSANRQHDYSKEDIKGMTGPFNYVKITIAPDGGISRVRIYGRSSWIDSINLDKQCNVRN